MDTEYTYEIEFDIVRSSRAEYEHWLERNAIPWVAHQAVTQFSVQHNRNGVTPVIRIRFGFQSLEQWSTFIESDVHTNATQALKEVSTGVSGTLWEQSAIPLDATQSGIQGMRPDESVTDTW